MTRPRDWPVLAGMLPLRRPQAAADVPAGLALAALAVPQALGYAKIAGCRWWPGLAGSGMRERHEE